jgi:ATP-dependent Clp protease ATP-binding subunit ClpA
MARLIQQVLKKPLAERILFGDLDKGGKVAVTIKDDKLDLIKE